MMLSNKLLYSELSYRSYFDFEKTNSHKCTSSAPPTSCLLRKLCMILFFIFVIECCFSSQFELNFYHHMIYSLLPLVVLKLKVQFASMIHVDFLMMPRLNYLRRFS